MGAFVIKPIVKVLAWIIALILVYLNVKMVAGEIQELYATDGNIGWKVIVGTAAVGLAVLLGYISLFPFLRKKKPPPSIHVHKGTEKLATIEPPTYKKIAVALDFSVNDQKLLSHAIGQGGTDTHYLLVHIVESASARFLGKDSDDFETRSDDERLQQYIAQLKEKGFSAEGKLGFNNRTREIVRIIKEGNADMLIIGAHGHSGIKDWLYGETIESVRHDIRIPVLIVNL